jgi:HNH endonuclease
MVTVERLHELLHYDPETGVFTWLASRHNGRAGTIAGWRRHQREGYRCITIDGRSYQAARLAWLWVTGKWPAIYIDHINGKPGDNRFANLREAGFSQSSQNTRTYGTNTSGVRGVSFSKRLRRWKATIDIDGKQIHLGHFDTKEDAALSYLVHASIYFGEFYRGEPTLHQLHLMGFTPATITAGIAAALLKPLK